MSSALPRHLHGAQGPRQKVPKTVAAAFRPRSATVSRPIASCGPSGVAVILTAPALATPQLDRRQRASTQNAELTAAFRAVQNWAAT